MDSDRRARAHKPKSIIYARSLIGKGRCGALRDRTLRGFVSQRPPRAKGPTARILLTRSFFGYDVRSKASAVPVGAAVGPYRSRDVRTCIAIVLLTAGAARTAPVPSAIEAERKALSSSDVSARRAAVLRLGWLGRDAEPAVPDLVKALRDPDIVVRHDATNTLVRIGPASAAALGKALTDENDAARGRAMDALTRLGPDAKDAIPALVERLQKSKSLLTRVQAAMALGRMGPAGRDALPALIAAAAERGAETVWRSYQPSSVCEAAIYAVKRIDQTALKKVADAALPTLRAMLGEEGELETEVAERQAATRALVLLGPHAAPALPSLCDARTLRGMSLRDFAIACASTGKDGQAHVIGLLTDPATDRETRHNLAQTLAAHPGLGPDAVRALAGLLAHEDDVTRYLAALVLSGQGPTAEPALPALVKALSDPVIARFANGFDYVVWALVRIGPKAVPALLDALKDDKIRDPAVRALGRLGPDAKAAIPALRKLLVPPEGRAAVMAARALVRIGDDPAEPVKVLVANLRTAERAEALENLENLDYQGSRASVPWIAPPSLAEAVPREAIPDLLALLDNEETARSAGAVLGQMRDHSAVVVPALVKRLRTEDRKNRDDLLYVLLRLGPAAKDAVPDILWFLRENPTESVRSMGFWALGAIGPGAKEAIPVLLRAAADRTDGASGRAIEALGQLGVGSPEVIDLLVKILREPTDEPGRGDRQVTAAWALMHLGPAAERALPALRDAQLSDYALIRVAATTALLRAGAPDASLDRLLAAWTDTYDPRESYPVLEHALSDLQLLGPRAAKAVPRLIPLLAEPVDRFDKEHRSQAVRVLGAIGPAAKAALPRLRELAAGRGSEAQAAARAIRAIEPEPKR
jgi:HEAT repeat protein